MTQSTLTLIDAHAAEYESDDLRMYKRTPRPFRRRRPSGRRRRNGSLSMNGRNSSRSTHTSLYRAHLATKLQEGNA